MRTLQGYEAIEMAEQFNIALYDTYYHHEVSVEQAKQFIAEKRDPQSFIIENWPDTIEEAVDIVLDRFQRALDEHRLSSARILDLNSIDGGLPIHPEAAELAAEQLAEEGKLQIVELHRDGNVYAIPANTYFNEQFLDTLRDMVCDKCAHLDLSGPFHAHCLQAMIEFFQNGELEVATITEVRSTPPKNGKLTDIIRPGIGFLSKTVSETRSKWQSVFKPIFANKDSATETAATTSEATAPTEKQATVEPQPHNTGPFKTEWSRQANVGERNTITKAELIEYLKNVEILDEQGRIQQMHQQREKLLQQIAEKDAEIHKIEQQQRYWEKQFNEMKRDMDTLLAAMQIAKRRSSPTDSIIDATFENKS